MLLLNLVVVTILLVSLVFLLRLLRELLLLSLTLQSIHKSNPFRKFFLWNISKMCKNKINGNRKIFSRSRQIIFGKMFVKNYSSIIEWVITSSIHSISLNGWKDAVRGEDCLTDYQLTDRQPEKSMVHRPIMSKMWTYYLVRRPLLTKYHGSPGKFVHVHKLESLFTLKSHRHNDSVTNILRLSPSKNQI